jgi:hypothetical protein
MKNIANAVLTNLIKTISENKLNIEQIFNKFDSNGEKSLDFDEFSPLVKIIDPTIPEKVIFYIFKKIDIKGVVLLL